MQQSSNIHINNNNEVKDCGATIKCPFGGADGTSNHFPNTPSGRQEAQAEAEKRNQGPYSTLAAVSSANSFKSKLNENSADNFNSKMSNTKTNVLAKDADKKMNPAREKAYQALIDSIYAFHGVSRKSEFSNKTQEERMTIAKEEFSLV